MIQPGSILFYKSGHFDYAGRLVAWYTGGPFCHCEIAINSTESIGAVAQGIARHTIPTPDAVAPSHLDSDGLALGIQWLEQQVGDKYSYADLADAALGRLLKHLPLLLVTPEAYDCSDLATRFLLEAGAKLPSPLAKEPSLVSPNDLARYFGIA